MNYSLQCNRNQPKAWFSIANVVFPFRFEFFCVRLQTKNALLTISLGYFGRKRQTSSTENYFRTVINHSVHSGPYCHLVISLLYITIGITNMMSTVMYSREISSMLSAVFLKQKPWAVSGNNTYIDLFRKFNREPFYRKRLLAFVKRKRVSG